MYSKVVRRVILVENTDGNTWGCPVFSVMYALNIHMLRS